MTRKTVVLVLWSILGLVAPSVCRGQIPSELPCATGSSDLLSPTYDSTTQSTRSWVCVDATGHVTSPVFATAGGTAFNTITSSTNTTAAMVVGTGASLGVSGTGTVTATNTSATVTMPNTTTLTPATGTTLTAQTPNNNLWLLEATGTIGTIEVLSGVFDALVLGNGTSALSDSLGDTFRLALGGASLNVPLTVPSCSGCSAVSSVFGRTGAVVATTGDYTATKISAGTFPTGVLGTTATLSDNTAALATDAWVQSLLSGGTLAAPFSITDSNGLIITSSNGVNTFNINTSNNSGINVSSAGTIVALQDSTGGILQKSGTGLFSITGGAYTFAATSVTMPSVTVTGVTTLTASTQVKAGAAGTTGFDDLGAGFSPTAMGAQTTATCTNITNMTWNIAANKNYVLRCEIPMMLAATATIQYCLGGPGTPTSYSLIAEGDLGTAGIWSQISTLAQTSYGTKTNASAAVAANTVQHVWAGIQNGATASGTALTLQTSANGTNAITVGANASCTLTQVN